MNDIEKQIEDSFKDDSLKKEDDNINNRINHRGNKDKNKKIIYILLFLAIIIIISLIAGILDMVSENVYVKHAFAGINVAVCALLVQAILKIGKSGVKDVLTAIIALTAFIITAVFNLSPVITVVAAGAAGCIYKGITGLGIKGGKLTV